MRIESKDGSVRVELTRRNLETLLWALDATDNPALLSPGGGGIVVAVEDAEHYTDREPGRYQKNGEWV